MDFEIKRERERDVHILLFKKIKRSTYHFNEDTLLLLNQRWIKMKI